MSQYEFCERIFYINSCLLRQQRPTKADIAHRFSKSIKTIERDIKFMREVLKVDIQQDDQYRYFYSGSGLELPDAYLTAAELSALKFAEPLLAQLCGPQIQQVLRNALDKVIRLLPQDKRQRLEGMSQKIGFSFSRVSQSSAESLPEILRALRYELVLDYQYYSVASDETTARTVNPFCLNQHNGIWYLLGFCHKRQQVRTFELSRISSCVAREEYFDRDPDFDLKDYFQGAFEIFRGEPGQPLSQVRVRFDDIAARILRTRRISASQKIEAGESNSSDHLILSFKLSNTHEILKTLLYWSPHVEILEPASLKVEYREALKQALEKNSK